MKTTISVPDDLWSDALAASEVGPSASAVVQEALRYRVDSLHASNMQPPELDPEDALLMNNVIERMRERANELYRDGYLAGVALAGRVEKFGVLREIALRGVVDCGKESIRVATAAWRVRHDKSSPDSDEAADATIPQPRYPGYFIPGDLFVYDLRTQVGQERSDIGELGLLSCGYIDEDDNIVTGSLDDRDPTFIAGADDAVRHIFQAASKTED